MSQLAHSVATATRAAAAAAAAATRAVASVLLLCGPAAFMPWQLCSEWGCGRAVWLLLRRSRLIVLGDIVGRESRTFNLEQRAGELSESASV